MGCLLCLFIKHKAVGVPDERSVVCVEEHLVWKLCEDEKIEIQVQAPAVIWLIGRRIIQIRIAFRSIELFQYVRMRFLPCHRAWNYQNQRWADGHGSLCRQSADHQGWICSQKRPHDPGPQSGWETQPSQGKESEARQIWDTGRISNKNPECCYFSFGFF